MGQKLTSHYHTEGFQELNSAAMTSGKNLNKTCCHNRSTHPKSCGEATCGERLNKRWSSLVLSMTQGMEQCQGYPWCWMPTQPGLSSGSGRLLRASCWRWKPVGPLPSLSLRLITRQEPEFSGTRSGNQNQHSWASEVSPGVWEPSGQVPGRQTVK